MQTLTKGFLLPEDGDDGSEFFPALAADIQQLNDHTHNGSDSQKLTAAASAALTQVLNPADWTNTGDGTGTYSITVTLPTLLSLAGLTVDTVNISFRSSTGRIIYLNALKSDATHFFVYSNNNALTVTVVYTT